MFHTRISYPDLKNNSELQHERPPTLLSLDRDRSLYLPSGQRTAVVAEDLAESTIPKYRTAYQVSRLGLGIG